MRPRDVAISCIYIKTRAIRDGQRTYIQITHIYHNNISLISRGASFARSDVCRFFSSIVTFYMVCECVSALRENRVTALIAYCYIPAIRGYAPEWPKSKSEAIYGGCRARARDVFSLKLYILAYE